VEYSLNTCFLPQLQQISMAHNLNWALISHWPRLDPQPSANYGRTGFLVVPAMPITKRVWADRKPALPTSQSLEMGLPVLERRRIPKSQLEVISIDWERSQAWLSITLLPPSLREPEPDDPQLLPGTRVSWHFSRSTSWSISTISHIPVSSLVTWDCLIWARIMAGLSRKAISSALKVQLKDWGVFSWSYPVWPSLSP